MENKYRKTLQRAFRVISPDFDPSAWSDQEFQNVFVNDVNFLLDHMIRRSKYIEEIKAKAPIWDGTPLVPQGANQDFMKVINIEKVEENNG